MVGGEQQQQEDDGLQQKDKKQQNKQQHKKQQTENPKKKQGGGKKKEKTRFSDIDTLTRSVTNIAKGIGLLFFGILGIVAFVVTTAYDGIKYVFKDAEKVRNDGKKKT